MATVLERVADEHRCDRRAPEEGETVHSRQPSVRFVEALTVVSEHLDHATLSDPALSALIHHVLHLRPKGDETRDLVVDFREVTTGDSVGVITGPVRVSCKTE
jgi:hypothetical protein